MKNKILFLFLLLSLLIGSGLGYLLTTYPHPQIPGEFIDLAIEEQSEFGKINAEIINSKLANVETEVLAINNLLKTIFQNNSFIPDLPSYYHDLDVVTTYNLSQIPAQYGYSGIYGREVAFGGSAFQIAPSTFVEDYREIYLEEEIASRNPLENISAQTLNEIELTAKLDHILPSLYRSDDQNVWINFASEKGYTRSYPYSQFPKDYDARETNWYSSAVTGAKDLIVLIDKSGSMEGNIREGAINATKNIIADLGGRDRFNIIGFSDRISQFSNSLSFVSEENFDDVSQFLDGMISGGTTDYELAFENGLDLLQRYGSDRREPVIVFITDGAPTIGTTNNNSLIEKIQQYNIGIDAEFVLFGIGNQTDQKLLDQMSVALEGTYQQINDTSAIEGAISAYEEYLSIRQDPSLVWSLPRTDRRDQGLVLTVSYPVRIDTTLKGVISVDILIDSITSIVQELQVQGESYSFVFDLAGTNILHPKRNSSEAFVDDIRVPIRQLENNGEEFRDMVELVQVDISSTQVIEYGEETRIVSLNPIGNSSMVYGLVTPLSGFLPDGVSTKLGQLEINQYSFTVGIGIGVVGITIMVVLRNRLTAEELVQHSKEEIEE